MKRFKRFEGTFLRLEKNETRFKEKLMKLVVEMRIKRNADDLEQMDKECHTTCMEISWWKG